MNIRFKISDLDKLYRGQWAWIKTNMKKGTYFAPDRYASMVDILLEEDAIMFKIKFAK